MDVMEDMEDLTERSCRVALNSFVRLHLPVIYDVNLHCRPRRT
jgi:hypothetical protein